MKSEFFTIYDGIGHEWQIEVWEEGVTLSMDNDDGSNYCTEEFHTLIDALRWIDGSGHMSRRY